MTTETKLPSNVIVTPNQVRKFFLEWAQNARDGKTLTQEETLAAPVEEVADTNTANFFEFFKDDSL